MKSETTSSLLRLCKKCWIPLTVLFFIMNFMTISWFVEEKNLTHTFYLFDYMIDRMERGRAVDLYYFLCDMSFRGINPFLVRPTAVIITLILVFITYNEIKSKKKTFFKWSFYLLLSLSIMFIAFIAFPFAEQAFLDDLASI